MTQKQTDYDKNIEFAWKEYQKSHGIYIDSLPDEKFSTAFRKGYEYGRKTRKEAKENASAFASDHIRDSTKMMRYELAKAAMNALIHSYGDRGYKWISENAVGYADALIKELEITTER